jgi:hypothetical protein
MQSSRDSSIWRSLAVAFGDGVAFGVGVKLAQGPNRLAAGAPPAEVLPSSASPYATRLEQIEQRIAAMEQAPAPVPSKASPAPAPFDQKVLEAVVNALDARLHEQAGQIERRLTELEAKLAIDLKSLHQQDHTIVTGLEGRLDEVNGQYNEHVIAIRDAVAQDMDVLYGQIARLQQEFAGSGAVLDERVAAAVTSRLESRIAAMEARLQRELAGAAERASERTTSAVTAQVDQQLAPLRAALAEKDREIAELRQRLGDNDQTVLDLILAIGEMCRQVAGRISGPVAAAAPLVEELPTDPPALAGLPAPPPSEAPSPEPPSETPSEQPLPELAMALAVPETNGHAHIEPIPIASAQRPSRLWRIPLVSSFLILAAGSLWILK